MHTEHRSIAAAATVRAHRSVRGGIQRHLLSPPRASLAGRIFADEIIACMIEARRPTSLEIQQVAARIWTDIQTGGSRIAWRDLVPGCSRYRRMIAAARAALGDGKNARVEPKPP